ncbi:MAG: hypothetical protein GQ574_00930 [Crocinitomix sp.]|nr:hypothetical protein [Crocinitomix sp.]
MDKIAFKKQILETAKARQLEIVTDFKVRIDDINGVEYITDEDQHDLDQMSANQSNKTLIAMLTKEWEFAKNELDFLNKMVVADSPLDSAVIGAVVVTDHKTFYPSVSVESFNVGDKAIFGISKNAPLFKEMEGKQVGDTFSFNDYDYLIMEVF